MPFRVVVIDSSRRAATVVVALEGAPHVGDELALPYGETVIVRHVTVADSTDVAGVIIAGPAPGGRSRA